MRKQFVKKPKLAPKCKRILQQCTWHVFAYEVDVLGWGFDPWSDSCWLHQSLQTVLAGNTVHPFATSNLGSCSQSPLHVTLGTDNTNGHNQIQMVIIPIWLASVLDCVIQTIWFKKMQPHCHYPMTNNCRFWWRPLKSTIVTLWQLTEWFYST